MSEPQETKAAASDENKLIAQRREKLNEIRSHRQAFPNTFNPTHLSSELADKYAGKDRDALEKVGAMVVMAGRIIRMRGPFVVIQDRTGQIQLYLNNKSFSDELALEIKALDLGDIIGVSGEVFKTNKDELSVRVASFELLTKSLRPLPDKFKGLTDMEMRYSQRYVDLIVNEESKHVFKTRSAIVAFIRKYFD